MDFAETRLIKGMDLVEYLSDLKKKWPNNWTRQKIQKISEITRLSYKQIYKWNWQYEKNTKKGYQLKIVGARVFWKIPHTTEAQQDNQF